MNKEPNISNIEESFACMYCSKKYQTELLLEKHEKRAHSLEVGPDIHSHKANGGSR